ncbi:alpha/beta fold hydrolase [Psychromicrobium xiongbiense]|uniref:alpha/beta fold hydrolase n=1 Tax=Psychromicrobium xiongbiense TaxID=3051184 RepID=UPI0025574574|nr:alpha/beta hydrolase [Psychromicrobium sp. YIM S02556]
MPYTSNADDAVQLAWAESGNPEGEPLLLVHGSALSKAVWRGMGYLAAFAADYRVLTLDLRGHGRSGKPHEPESYRLERVVGDVLAVLDAAGVARTHYLGYSFGARTGFALAETSPERMRSFVSVAGTYHTHPGTIAELFFADYDEALARAGMPGFLAGWETALGRSVDPATRQAFLANDAQALRAYFHQVESGVGVEETALAGLNVPTLLLAGTQDEPRMRASLRAAELMPNAQFIALPGRGHSNTLMPSAQVLDVVLPFLAQW